MLRKEKERSEEKACRAAQKKGNWSKRSEN